MVSPSHSTASFEVPPFRLAPSTPPLISPVDSEGSSKPPTTPRTSYSSSRSSYRSPGRSPDVTSDPSKLSPLSYSKLVHRDRNSPDSGRVKTLFPPSSGEASSPSFSSSPPQLSDELDSYSFPKTNLEDSERLPRPALAVSQSHHDGTHTLPQPDRPTMIHSHSVPVSPTRPDPSTFLATRSKSSTWIKYSEASQGQKSKPITPMPKIPSLARAPPDVRVQMSERRSEWNRMGKLQCLIRGGKSGPPSPPVVMSPEKQTQDDGEKVLIISPITKCGIFSDAQSTGNSSSSTSSSRSTSPPHRQFLANSGLPPPDCGTGYIAVSTSTSHYEILVRLEGVSLDSIMLSTRRNRVLHLSAERYTSRGGHWERKIRFGWDADLKGVKADFDGEVLKVLVPRESKNEA